MKRAVLFLNLGGPETLAEVRPFLYRLFADPEVIRIPVAPLRKFVAWSIARAREKTSQALYRTIGGGSPIRRLSEQQASATEALLRQRGLEADVRVAFTCSAPLLEDVVKDLARRGAERFLAFPLYPQYSLTTTKGSLERARRAVQEEAPSAAYHEIRSFPTHDLFVRAHAELIRSESGRFSEPEDHRIHLLFSAHSIPEKLVSTGGDPYKSEIEATVAAVVKAARWAGPYSVSWQSKLGPVKWLEPATLQVIRELGRAGTPQVLVVPIAFVTDHIETLNEIDILFRVEAVSAGIREFRRTPGLNNHPTFLAALAEIAAAQKDFWA